ncbi:MAG: hypothetical protein FWG60_02100 [Methanomassiliicoccaceae archaeon]|nr:hypothetical protein [Methanomassiliicoccaceae archaeon]
MKIQHSDKIKTGGTRKLSAFKCAVLVLVTMAVAVAAVQLAPENSNYSSAASNYDVTGDLVDSYPSTDLASVFAVINGHAGTDYTITASTFDYDVTSFTLDAGKVVTLTTTGNFMLLLTTPGAIHGTVYGDLTLRNILIAGNNDDSGGIVVESGGVLNMDNASLIANCRSTSAGGGVYVHTGGTLNMYGNSEIANCQSTDTGGGVYNGGTFSMTDNALITSCKALYGGGVFNAGQFTMEDNANVASNTADRAGGVYNEGTFTMNDYARAWYNKADFNGGGVYNEGTFTINDSAAITNNKANHGGGVYNESTFNISGGVISENSATGNGGGIDNYTGTFTMSAGSINFNDADYGGGVNNEGTFTISGTAAISNNKAVYNGGGIYNPSSLTIEGGTINANKAEHGGGIYTTDTSSIIVKGGRIYSNAANGDGVSTGGQGGGIFSEASTFTIEGGEIYRNDASDGAGIYLNDKLSTFFMTNGKIYLNTATDCGGGIYNKAILSITGGEIYQNQAEDGAGIFIEDDCTSAQISACLIRNNTATGNGGGIYNKGADTRTNCSIYSNTAASGGGGIYNNGTFAVLGNAIYNNGANFGGGVFNAGMLTMSGSSEIYGNEAEYGGGAYNESSFTQSDDSEISGNGADYGGGVYNTGDLEMSGNAAVSDNETEYDGGGIYNGGVLKISGGTVSDNTAGGIGGGIYTEAYTDATVSIDIAASAVFTGNTASFGMDVGKTAAELLALFPFIRTDSHSTHPTLAFVHPLNNYDINVFTFDVTVYYVDYDDNPVGLIVSTTYVVVYYLPFSLAKADIPSIAGYSFKDWKIGIAGMPEGNTTVFLPSVTSDTEIYLIYGPAQVKEYFIKATADSFTTISPSGTVTVPAGTSKTFTFSANPGFYIKDVIVDGVYLSGAEIGLGYYTFSNVLYNHTITVVGGMTPRADITLRIDVMEGSGYAEYSINGGTAMRYVSIVNLPEHANVIVYAYAGDGYEFKEWRDGSIVIVTYDYAMNDLMSSVQLELYFTDESGSGLSNLFWWIAATLLLLLAGLLFWFIIFYRRYYDIYKQTAVPIVGDEKVHRKSEYTFSVTGNVGKVSYRVGEDGQWKILLPNADGTYTVPKKEVVDDIYLEAALL